MLDADRNRIQQTVGKKLRPRWMHERHELDSFAKLFEERLVFESVVVFGKRDERDRETRQREKPAERRGGNATSLTFC